MNADDFVDCSHGNRIPRRVLTDLPADGEGPCVVCAYAKGRGGASPTQPPINVDSAINEIRENLDILRRCRSGFPHILPTAIGSRQVRTPEYFRAHGYDIRFLFQTDLTEQEAREIHRAGQWINESFLVRLWSVLESHHVVGANIGIVDDIDGSVEVKLLHRLRQPFAHGSGRFDPDDRKHRQLRNDLVAHFVVDTALCPEDWYPLPIQDVLEKLASACERYVEGVGRLRMSGRGHE